MKLNIKFNETEENIPVDFDGGDSTFETDMGEVIAVPQATSVLYTPQELTEEQQAQARENIGVVDYELPVATANTLGGVKIGSGFSVEEDGTLSSTVEGDKTFIYNQYYASDVWHIEHNLNKYPSVTFVDSANSIVVGNVVYNSLNTLTASFNGAFSGTAYLN